MKRHLADLTNISKYEVCLEFTPRMDPLVISNGKMPLVSLSREIRANSLIKQSRLIHSQYGRIPYSSPLYWWEAVDKKTSRDLYIGQTVNLALQKRFEYHHKIVRLLCRYVNDKNVHVYFRLNSRFDLISPNGQRVAIEHLPPVQAKRVLSDVEAFLIYTYRPEFNDRLTNRKKRPWKPFSLKEIKKY